LTPIYFSPAQLLLRRLDFVMEQLFGDFRVLTLLLRERDREDWSSGYESL